MKSDTFHMSMLFDFYGELLTDKQKELFDLYYNEDMSLTEISEIVGITRQGVRDAVMRAEMSLRDIEDRVGLVKRYSRLSDKVAQIGDCAHYIAMVNSGSKKDFQIAEQTNKILKIVGEIQ
ncbi:MAG: YlxM family DNA-binding protein [Clostridia bacterium]|nr:YlxM family DNA-binding protein [Clostridia bacterium]MBR3865810.1 YlxM family DNA-binding protein [Clostridia bacterium]